jgi:hypothetical protein
MTLNIDLSVLKHEPEEVYHARAGEYLSSHLLADFRKSPLLYHERITGLARRVDKESFLVGRATHVRILEGKAEYLKRFAIGDGPINKTTGKPFGATSKAYMEWAEAQGKPVLSEAQAAEIEQLARGVSFNPTAVDLIVDGVAEGVIRTTYCGPPCQARLDHLNPHRGIVDLKTTTVLEGFEFRARQYGYGHQLAFYRSLLAAVTGEVVPVYLVAVEREQPQRARVYPVERESLDRCQAQNEAAIERLKVCAERNDWPTGTEEPVLLTF